MPSRLKRYQDFGSYHFVTFSCYRRLALLNSDHAKLTFERTLEELRRWYGLYIFGYVAMPEHIHLLVSEPRTDKLSSALQMLKQLVSRHLQQNDHPFWQPRYYDFNVFTHKKWREKLRYLHRNPVTRGLVAAPEDWPWSSYRHYYQIMNFSGSAATGSIPIGETNTSDTGWFCQGASPTLIYSACGSDVSHPDGTFTDGWHLSSPTTLQPPGCGFTSDSSTWNWCDGHTFTHELVVDSGFVHTDQIREFGTTAPPSDQLDGTSLPH